MRCVVLKSLQKWFLSGLCLSGPHDSVGVESWKRISTVASVNPQEGEWRHRRPLPIAEKEGTVWGGEGMAAEQSVNPCLRSSELAFFSDSQIYAWGNMETEFSQNVTKMVQKVLGSGLG